MWPGGPEAGTLPEAPEGFDGTMGDARSLQLYPDARRLARRVFVAFLLTFVAARLLVFGIMARWLPDLFWHLGGTHVHHLNYGIFLLAGIGAFLLVAPVSPANRLNVAWLYGIGLALTFDEFGMWLHLGGGYWQRASFDAVMVLGGVLGIAAFAPPIRQWRPKNWGQALMLAALVAGFYWALTLTLGWTERVEPRLEHLEEASPQ
jgi:hypothetical protein